MFESPVCFSILGGAVIVAMVEIFDKLDKRGKRRNVKPSQVRRLTEEREADELLTFGIMDDLLRDKGE